MKVLFSLTVIVAWLVGTCDAQEREFLHVKVRKEINDTLFSHFNKGAGVRSLYCEIYEHHEFEELNVNFVGSFGFNLYVDQEIGQGSVYDSIQNYARRNAVKIYNVNDTNLFVLVPYCLDDSFVQEKDKNKRYERIMKSNFRKNDYLPIPFIDDENPFWDDKAYNGWGRDIKLYVLAAESGKYLNDIYLSERHEILPEKWEHGYSRGIAIDEKNKEIYYWLVIW